MRIKLLSIAAFVMLLSACGASINSEFHDPSFNAGIIGNQGITVGGVAMVHGSPAKRASYANLMQSDLQQNFNTIEVTGTSKLINALGRTTYNKMMAQYMVDGDISQYDMSKVSARQLNSRYIAFARIRNDSVSRSRSDYTISQEHEISVNFYTKRNIAADVSVYDLNQKRVVWRGAMSDSESNSNNYSKPAPPNLYDAHNRHDFNRKMIETAAAAYLGNEVEKNARYPGAPSSNAVLHQIFKKFASHISKFS